MFFDDYLEPRKQRARKYEGLLKRIEYAPVERTFVNPWSLPVASEVVFDTECFKNYFMCGFKHLPTQSYFYCEKTEDRPLPTEELLRVMYWFKSYSFNGLWYDLPVIELACKGAPLDELKGLSDEIILEEKRVPSRGKYNHIDLIEVAPLEGSLKTYAARLHCRRMQDLPIDPHKYLTPEDIESVRDYCFNDLDNTELLLDEPTYGLRPYIEMRERLGSRYNVDLRSKSDAQVAEAVINAELKRITGMYPKKPGFDEHFQFQYEAPEWVQFQTPMLREVLQIVEGTTFYLDGGGSPRMPEELADLKIRIGKSLYKMGMGGLHSTESTIAQKADDETDLEDTDVASYYPRIILNNEYVPEHLGPVYLEAYGGIVEERLVLKKQKHPDADGLKIAVNGTFGKQGNMYSTIYAPKLLIQTTVTGQLGLLLLIEACELANFEVVSANTDGFVTKIPKVRRAEFDAIVRGWEAATGFETEATRYAALYSRDVNNYIAVKDEGSCKAKGTYSERGSALNSALSKNPEALICSDAVQAFLSKGTPIEETIFNCKDIRRFVVVRNVRGGGHKDGYYLGKVVRWYYAEEVTGIIQYVGSGNKVSNSEGGKPLMELPDLFPNDIKYSWYVDKATSILYDIGYYAKSKQGGLFD
jgi:hypothetical protein